MRLSHAHRAIDVRFDDPNLVSCGGLVPVLTLADRCGLATLLQDRLKIASKGGANAAAKVFALVAGMICGADSIDDLDLLRHGGMRRLFVGVRAPSTLGTFLRVFTFGHVRQLDAVAAGLLTRLVAATPVLPDADQLVLVDVDDTVRQTYGYAKQGAGRGYSGVKGLNALRLVVRRVRPTPGSQLALFTAWDYHAFVTDRPGELVEIEADHRRHAIVEQSIAELKSAGLAHLPSGRFMANAAWLALSVMAHNLGRGVGILAGPGLHRATAATLRRALFCVPGRLVRSARRLHLRLPAGWPWATAFRTVLARVTAPPIRS